MTTPAEAVPKRPRRRMRVGPLVRRGDVLREHPGTQEVVLAVGLTTAVSMAITADLVHTGTLRPGAYLFALAFGGVLLLRTRAPRTILAVTIFGIFAYYAIGFSPIGMALPAMGALYSAAETNHTRSALFGGVVLAAASTYFRIQKEALSTTYLFSYDLLTNLALVAAAITLGVNVRNRRSIHEQQCRLQELTALHLQRAAEQRMQAERLRIARDLHDAIGHSIAVVALHSNVAREAIGRDDAAAARAVTQVQNTASATLRDLRTTVHLLRSPLNEESPTLPTGLVGLERLARTARNVGIDMSLRVEVDPGCVPTAIDVTAFRIVQEAVTNMIRHSGARHGAITARRVGDDLQIEVTDDGSGLEPPRDPPGSLVGSGPRGQGLLGMRERAALLGGEVTSGTRTGGGFLVHAQLPLGNEP
ncbi:MAG: sensor histidine kinase [Humibacillus sp.]|nr:sensor histidine kinase [Humibacillus sp.]MDN5777359.1 sensor histidine kinase [Humibacillus sp.]